MKKNQENVTHNQTLKKKKEKDPTTNQYEVKGGGTHLQSQNLLGGGRRIPHLFEDSLAFTVRSQNNQTKPNKTKLQQTTKQKQDKLTLR
jgi:hypothetical protein